MIPLELKLICYPRDERARNRCYASFGAGVRLDDIKKVLGDERFSKAKIDSRSSRGGPPFSDTVLIFQNGLGLPDKVGSGDEVEYCGLIFEVIRRYTVAEGYTYTADIKPDRSKDVARCTFDLTYRPNALYDYDDNIRAFIDRKPFKEREK